MKFSGFDAGTGRPPPASGLKNTYARQRAGHALARGLSVQTRRHLGNGWRV